ncbi:hypothetical protein MIDIC_110069 [Alphaproteobacteria bacterium]
MHIIFLQPRCVDFLATAILAGGGTTAFIYIFTVLCDRHA